MTTTEERKELNAERLLGGSVKRSYNSLIDIDWDAPIDPDMFFLPPEASSLYGTPLWDSMTHRQRVELTKHEYVNLLSVGHWFENTLNQALMRLVLKADPTSRHAQYALTEVGDETRHMIMFGRVIEAIGERPFLLNRTEQRIVQALPRVYGTGLMLWVSALIGEEIFDHWQRQVMKDERVQPITRQMMKIHVTEEARHIRWAREGVVRRLSVGRRLEVAYVRLLISFVGPLFRRLLINPGAFKRAGLDPKVAVKQAMANPDFAAYQQFGFSKLHQYLEEQKLLTGYGRRSWRRSGWIG
ncbi:diiron oxygenase [Pseudonocardiaceae bacterium YIM PH 21723]|nr:diiron oxygenase [Pseudonocardiaceae bacterium YIM PH 21723]